MQQPNQCPGEMDYKGSIIDLSSMQADLEYLLMWIRFNCVSTQLDRKTKRMCLNYAIKKKNKENMSELCN